MNESGDRYTLCVKTEDDLIPIAKFNLKEIDDITMGFNNPEELFQFFIDNKEHDIINFVDKAKLDNINHPSISKAFVLEHQYKGSKYSDVLYKKDEDFNNVRKYLFYILKTSKKYLDEVLFNNYNQQILNNKKTSKELLETVLKKIDHCESKVEDERIQEDIAHLYNGIYKTGPNKKADYKMCRMGYIDSMKFVKKYDLYGKFANEFNYKQLNSKNNVVELPTNSLEQQVEIDIARYR